MLPVRNSLMIKDLVLLLSLENKTKKETFSDIEVRTCSAFQPHIDRRRRADGHVALNTIRFKKSDEKTSSSFADTEDLFGPHCNFSKSLTYSLHKDISHFCQA